MSGGGLALPAAGAVSGETVAFAAGLIDRSGRAPVIEAALAKATGRPRPLPVRAVLTALLCLALGDRPLFLTEATRLLFCQLGDTSRALLGVTGIASGQHAFLAAYRRVRYCVGAILSVMDPSALPKNRRLSEPDLKARTRPMTPAQAEAARGRLEAFLNSLLEASISVLAGEELDAYDGSAGLDATPVPLFSRGPSKRAGLCASDPDGGWYVREGDHREREDDKGKPLKKITWALEATIATTARPPGSPPGCPHLAIGLALARPGEDPGGTGARVLASVAARGHKTGWLGYDRACTQALPERFHLPARALGYSRSWTTAPASPASRPAAAAPCWPRAPGTAPPCPSRSSPRPPACAITPSAGPPTTRRSPPAPPTGSTARTARTPTGTSGCPAPPRQPPPADVPAA